MDAAVTNVSFDRDARGRAIVGWSVAGSCDRVDIALVNTPDAAINLDRAHTVDANLCRVLLDDLPSGPAYVRVAPSGRGAAVIAGERNLGLLGARNFRDLGGYPAAGGARTRWGRVFRSDALLLEESDLETFAGLGVRAIYDLRSDAETRASPPTACPPETDRRAAPVDQ